MKIIAKDSLDRDTVSDLLVCENVASYYAYLIKDLLNREGDLRQHWDKWYMAVEDKYVLYEWKP